MHPSPDQPTIGGCPNSLGMKPPNYGVQWPAEVYTRDQMRRLLGAFSRRGSAGIRNCAMTALLYRCGLRVGEAVKAPLGDLDLAGGTFYVRFPKRDSKGRWHPRRVAIDAETAALLERWLARRRSLGIPNRGPLFCRIDEPHRGEPINTSGYRSAIRRAGSKAGLPMRMHPHGLRHSFAFDWVQEGLPLDQLQLLLGHRHLSTTAHYAQHLNPRVALDAQRARTWSGTPAAPAALPADVAAQVRELVAELMAA